MGTQSLRVALLLVSKRMDTLSVFPPVSIAATSDFYGENRFEATALCYELGTGLFDRAHAGLSRILCISHFPDKPAELWLEEMGVATGLTEETLDASVAGVRTQAEFDVVFPRLKKALTERILPAELTKHLGYLDGPMRPAEMTNAWNWPTPKTVLTESGTLSLETIRD
jgi:hypothetical protein